MKKKGQALKLDEEAAKCEVCATRDATVLCDEDNVRLCSVCDMSVHSANKIAQRHTRWPLCNVCHRLKATKTSTTPQEQGINVCTACVSTVPRGKLQKLAGALAAPALHHPQVWVRGTTCELGSGIGPPAALSPTKAGSLLQPADARDAPFDRSSQGPTPAPPPTEGCGASMDPLDMTSNGLQLRCSDRTAGSSCGAGGADTPDVLDALFTSWGEEVGRFEDQEADATAAAAGDLDLSMWADSPTDMVAAPDQLASEYQPEGVGHVPSTYTAGGMDTDLPHAEVRAAATTGDACVLGSQPVPSTVCGEEHGLVNSPVVQPHDGYQLQQRQDEFQQAPECCIGQTEGVQECGAVPSPALQNMGAMSPRYEQPPIEASLSQERQQNTFYHQQILQQQQRSSVQQVQGQVLYQSSQYELLGQDTAQANLQQQYQQQQQQGILTGSSQLAALAALAALASTQYNARQPSTDAAYANLQQSSPAASRPPSNGSQVMECSQAGPSAGRDAAVKDASETSMGLLLQRHGQLPSLQVDVGGSTPYGGAGARPGATQEGMPNAGATAMSRLEMLLSAHHTGGLTLEQQRAVQSLLAKDPASGLIGSMGASLSAPPAFGMMAPSPRQSCDGASMMQSAGYYVPQQQSLHAPVVTPVATANAPPVGAFQQPFSSVNLMPNSRIEKGPLSSLYEAAFLSAAGMINPWRPGLLPAGLSVGTGGLQLPAGLMAAGSLPLQLLGPIQTLTNTAWAQAVAQSSGSLAGCAAGSGQQSSQQQQPSEAGLGAGQHHVGCVGAPSLTASGMACCPTTFEALFQLQQLQQQQIQQHLQQQQQQKQISQAQTASLGQSHPQTSATQHHQPFVKQEACTSNAQATSSHHGSGAGAGLSQPFGAPRSQAPPRVSSNGNGIWASPPTAAAGAGSVHVAPYPPHADCATKPSGNNACSVPQQHHQFATYLGSQQLLQQQLAQQSQLKSAGAGMSHLGSQGFQHSGAHQLWQQQSQLQQQAAAAQARGGHGMLGTNSSTSALLLFNQQQQQQFQQLQQLLLQSAGQGPRNQQHLLMQLAQQQQQHTMPQSAMAPPSMGHSVSPDAFGSLLMSPMAQWLMMNMSHAASSVNAGMASVSTAGGTGLPPGLQLFPGAAAAFNNVSAAAAALVAAGIPTVSATSALAGSQGPVPVTLAAAAATSAAMAAPAPEASLVSRERDPRDREARDHAERDEALTRYRQKRKTRHFEKTIRYASRQILSHKRPRIKGRFVKTQPCQAAIIGMSPATTHEPNTSEDPEAGDEADDEQEVEVEDVEEENDPLRVGINKAQRIVESGVPLMDLDGPAATTAEGPQEAVGGGGLGMAGRMDICDDDPGGCRNSVDAMEVEVSGGEARSAPPRGFCSGGAGSGGAGGGAGGAGEYGGGIDVATGDNGGCASSGAGAMCAAVAMAGARDASVGGSNGKASPQHATAGADLLGEGHNSGAPSVGAATGAHPAYHHPYHHPHYVSGGRHYNHHHVSAGQLAGALGQLAGPHAGAAALGARNAVGTAVGGDGAVALGDCEARQLVDVVAQLSCPAPAHANAQAALSGSAHAQVQRGMNGGTHHGGVEDEEAVGPSHSVNSRLSAGSVHTPGLWRVGGAGGGPAAGAGPYEEVCPRGISHSHNHVHGHPPIHPHSHPYQHDGEGYWGPVGAASVHGNGVMKGRQQANAGATPRGNSSGDVDLEGTVSTNGVAKTGCTTAAKVHWKAGRHGNKGGGTAICGGLNVNVSGTAIGVTHVAKMSGASVALVTAVPASVSPGSMLLLPVALPTPLLSQADMHLINSVAKVPLDEKALASTAAQLSLQRQGQQTQLHQHPMLAPGVATCKEAVGPAATTAAAGDCSGGTGCPVSCSGGAGGARNSPRWQQTAVLPCLPMPSTASCGGVSPFGAVGVAGAGAGATGCRGTPAACCLVPDCATDAAAPCCMSGGGTTEQGSCMEDNHTLVDTAAAGGGAGDGEGDSECCSAEPLVSGASNTVPSVEASTHGQGQQRLRGRRSSPQLSVRM